MLISRLANLSALDMHDSMTMCTAEGIYSQVCLCELSQHAMAFERNDVSDIHVGVGYTTIGMVRMQAHMPLHALQRCSAAAS